MKLTKEEKALVEGIQRRFKEALIERAKNPADFETNKTFLKAKLALTDEAQAIIDANKKALTSQLSTGFFSPVSNIPKRWKLDHGFTEVTANNLLFTPENEKLWDEQVAQEPRIIATGATSVMNDETKAKEEHYIICYSNGERHFLGVSNNDNKPWEEFRNNFEERMSIIANQELINHRRFQRH